jgi:hypothetical protein
MMGGEHVLRFTMSSMAWLSEKYGSVKAAIEAMSKAGEGFGVKEFHNIADLFYAALKHEGKGLVPSDIEDALDFGEALDLLPSLLDAYTMAMGAPKKGQDQEGPEGENPPKA